MGDIVGFPVGDEVGDKRGAFVIVADGELVREVGFAEGDVVGVLEGVLVGAGEGALVGIFEGSAEG